MLKLFLDGEWKEYKINFISGKMFRLALELDQKRNDYVRKMLDSQEGNREMMSLLDELFAYICMVFGDQFTPEQYEEGTDARNIIDQSWAIVHGIISQTLEPLPVDEDSKKNMKK